MDNLDRDNDVDALGPVITVHVNTTSVSQTLNTLGTSLKLLPGALS